MYNIKDKSGNVVAQMPTLEKAITAIELLLDEEEEFTICKTED